MDSNNEKNSRINLLRQGCQIIGIALIVGVFLANSLVPVASPLLFFGVFTGITYLSMSFTLTKRPQWFSICSWIFSITLLINFSVVALSKLGFATPILGLMAISPVIASLLLGSRGGIGIYFGAFFCLFAIFWIDFNQIIPFTVAPRFELYKLKIAAMLLILTISLLIALAYERDRKNSENRLQAAHDEAVKASAAKTLFLANMSHEIRTPMNGVLGNAGLLIEDDLSPAQKKIVATILKSGESMMQILNDILDFSKIGAGQLSLYQQTFDLCEQFTSIYHLFEMRASEKGIDFHLDIEQGIPSNVYSDSTRIRQIISNLVSNAIKFTDEGRVTLRVRNKNSNKDKIKIRVEIEDTGIGIDDNILQNLFKEFSQADLSTTKEFGGTGLGLAISQRLAKLLGSKIEVESTRGKGSIFSIELDLKLVAPASVTSNETESKEKFSDKEKLASLSILLVEDNDINLELAGNYLKRFGIIFDTAINGKEAVDMIKSNVYDIVLMDCQMPIMDGYEATRAIRKLELSQQPTIIAMTANAMNGDEEKCRNAGMDDYLSKPISRSKLTKILEKWNKIFASNGSHRAQLKA